MHISLDSALGRQRRLNSVGESVLQIAPDAAAAYSLRSLTGGDPDVVRVRRESDNTEKDFSGSQIESGEMARWVNEQPTLPLDLRELDTNTGERDGALIEAAAAYSLRKLKEDFTGDVVEVRRSSDGAVQSFTASEVADGTLEDWVNNYQTELSVARNYTSNPYESFTSASSSGFTASNSSGTGFAGFDLSGASGDEVEVSFDLNIRSGSPQIRLRAAYNSSNGCSNGSAYTTGGTKTITLTATADFGFIAFSEGGIPSDFDVSNFQIVSRSANGHVRTWYDQSGSDNHAVQTTPANQPKIVEGGSLLEDGILFDGSEYLDHATSLSQSFYLFANYQTSVNNSPVVGADGSSTTAGATISRRGSGEYIQYAGTPSATGVHGDDKKVASALFDGANSEAYWNGTKILDGDAGTQTNMKRIGGNGSDRFTGSIGEIIIYDSDQSDNRTAIEANIGETYGITGIPAANDTVNGYVQTWYDQSGNVPANDAVQTTASNQPKIVVNGNLVTENGKPAIEFDGVDEVLKANSLASSFSGEDLPISAFSVSQSDVTTKIANIWRFGNSGATNPIKGFQYRSGGVYGFLYRADNGTSKNRLAIDNYSAATEYQHSLIVPSTTVSIWENSANILLNQSADVDLVTLNEFFIGRSLDGKVKEIIIYDSDQSSNRTAIEANINNQYDIY